MYAVVTVWQMEKDKAAEQEQVLHQRIVTSASRAPGFVAGYWTIDDATSTAHGMIVLETEEASRHFKESVESNRPNQEKVGVRPQELVITRVLAHAGAQPSLQ
jgi:branched-subunit amino acid permease